MFRVRVAGGVGAKGAGSGGRLAADALAGGEIFEGDAVFGGGEVFGREPPGNGKVLHGFEHETGSEGRGVTFHHFVVEGADGLDLAERKGVGRIGVLDIEVVGAPGFGVGVVVGLGGKGEQGVGLVIHEIAADLVGAVGETAGVGVGRRG